MLKILSVSFLFLLWKILYVNPSFGYRPFDYKNWTFLVHMTCGTTKCFGVLIKANWVLTSASCLYTGLCQQIHIGEPKDYFSVNVSGSIKYPFYEELPDTLHESLPANDIALIMLKAKIDRVKFLEFSNKVPDRNLKCQYLILRRGNLTVATTNNFLKCVDINVLFNIPDVDPKKVFDICDKICVTSNYFKSDVTYWGGPLICNNQIQGVYSNSIYHDSQKKSSWTIPYAYSEWINTVIEYNDNRAAQKTQYSSCEFGKSRINSYLMALFIFVLLEFQIF